MDMALHLGMTAAGVSSSMTEGELRRWSEYASRRMLPMRRIEMYLAQIAYVVQTSLGGGKDVKLSDYLFDSDDDGEGDEDDAASFFGAVTVGGQRG